MADVLPSTTNRFQGVVVDPESLPADPEAFCDALARSLRAWLDDGFKVAWLEIPIEKSALIPLAVDAGFVFHHSGKRL